MKKVALIFLILLSSVFFSNSLEENFIKARNFHDINLIKEVISDAKKEQNNVIYAEALMEYALWGDSEDKEKLYTEALEVIKKEIEKDPNNGRAYYVAGAIVGRLAQYKGIVQSLFMLNDFDNYIEKAIEILDDNFYKGLALIAMGMRFRDVPWPLRSYKKAEKYLLDALEVLPNYPNIHLELGKLYEKMGKIEEAKKEYEIVINSNAHPLLNATHEEAKEEARQLLQNLK
ncbi:tetratricopeptide repeat protein [Thermosipho globiformans]|uniref:tetratricopeptide repeat protein n=1 Tax=Thermosipho globiformans TaxID=380685 RepID=UPI000F8DE38B|nr:tetratricopeptide repeat protein [Thermosipho globiformans]